MLTNLDLDEIASQLGIPLKGVFMKNELPKERTTGNYIINLESSNKGGSHWTALIVREKTAFYFDSFGALPCVELIRFCKKAGTHLYFNNWIIQDLKSSLCGFYCIGLLLHVSENQQREKSLESICNDFINMFYDNTKRNGDILKKYLRRYDFSLKRYLLKSS